MNHWCRASAQTRWHKFVFFIEYVYRFFFYVKRGINESDIPDPARRWSSVWSFLRGSGGKIVGFWLWSRGWRGKVGQSARLRGGGRSAVGKKLWAWGGSGSRGIGLLSRVGRARAR